MVVDGESEVGVVGGLSQPHIVEGIQSCCRHVPWLPAKCQILIHT